MEDCRLEYLETSNRSFCKTHQRDEIACVKEELRETKLQNDEMKKILRYIVDPILKADEEKEPDKHMFCRCVYCRAWNLYEEEPTEKRKGGP